MSVHSRMENIKEMEEEKIFLEKKISLLRESVSTSSEASDKSFNNSVDEIKTEETVSLVVKEENVKELDFDLQGDVEPMTVETSESKAFEDDTNDMISEAVDAEDNLLKLENQETGNCNSSEIVSCNGNVADCLSESEVNSESQENELTDDSLEEPVLVNASFLDEVKVEEYEVKQEKEQELYADEHEEEHVFYEDEQEDSLSLDVDVSDVSDEDDSFDEDLSHYVSDKSTFFKLKALSEESPSFDVMNNDETSSNSFIKEEVQLFVEDEFVHDNDVDRAVEVPVIFEEDIELERLNDSLMDMYLGTTGSKRLVKELLSEIFERVWQNISTNEEVLHNSEIDDFSEVKNELMIDLLGDGWTQADRFREVFSHDESSQELLAIFEAGSLTFQLLLDSLPSLGWVNQEEADFLPLGWFMKMKMGKSGKVSFQFLTNNLEILVNPTEAVEYMSKKGYNSSGIDKFHENFIIED